MAEERKYRIRVDGILVDVSKEVYRAYYSIERHTRTLDEKDIRNGKVLYSDLDTDELLGEDMIPDMTSERVEDSAIYSITTTGRLRRIDEFNQVLILVDDIKIPLTHVVDLDSEKLPDMNQMEW